MDRAYSGRNAIHGRWYQRRVRFDEDQSFVTARGAAAIALRSVWHSDILPSPMLSSCLRLVVAVLVLTGTSGDVSV